MSKRRRTDEAAEPTAAKYQRLKFESVHSLIVDDDDDSAGKPRIVSSAGRKHDNEDELYFMNLYKTDINFADLGRNDPDLAAL